MSTYPPTHPPRPAEFCQRGSLYDVLKQAGRNQALSKQLDWVKRINMALDAAKVCVGGCFLRGGGGRGLAGVGWEGRGVGEVTQINHDWVGSGALCLGAITAGERCGGGVLGRGAGQRSIHALLHCGACVVCSKQTLCAR